MAMVKPQALPLFSPGCTDGGALAPLAIPRLKLLQIMVNNYIFKGDVHGMTVLASIILGALVLEVTPRYFFLYYLGFIGAGDHTRPALCVRSTTSPDFTSIIDKTPIGQSQLPDHQRYRGDLTPHFRRQHYHSGRPDDADSRACHHVYYFVKTRRW
ncbi:MAG: hypothetical protein IPK76_07250 [Lewinellaceae bacterium]|nr:hypothetical protein [Lewinellaceae bacterium]